MIGLALLIAISLLATIPSARHAASPLKRRLIMVRAPSHGIDRFEMVPVSDLQILLQILGFYLGPIDGRWHDSLMKALVDFSAFRYPVSIMPHPEVALTKSGIVTRTVGISPKDLLVALDRAAWKKDADSHRELLKTHGIIYDDPSEDWQHYRSSLPGLQAWWARVEPPRELRR